MNTSSYSILTTTTTTNGRTFSLLELSADDVTNAVQTTQGDTEAALRSAVRSGLFSPITAAPSDSVTVELNPDGSAVIVVVAVIPTTTTTNTTTTATANAGT